LTRRLGLVGQFAILSLIPLALLAVALGIRLQDVIQQRAVANAAQEAELLSQLAIQPLLTPADLEGISPARTLVLDQALEGSTMGAGHPVARVKIWNSAFQVIYSTDHSGRAASQPTIAARDEILSFFTQRLAPSM
jgi:hypothetical protein